MQRRIVTLIAVAVLAIGLAACGSSSKSSNNPPATSAGGGAPATTGDTITIQNFKFSSVTVKPGATVTVKNMDSTTHTSTASKGEWDTGNIDAGQSKTFTAPSAPGTYAFHCNIHQFMTGTLTVAS